MNESAKTANKKQGRRGTMYKDGRKKLKIIKKEKIISNFRHPSDATKTANTLINLFSNKSFYKIINCAISTPK